MIKQDINFEPMYTPSEVCAMFGICRVTLWRWEKSRPDFPKPIKINCRVTRYLKSDIEAFKLRARDQANGQV